VHKVLTFDAGWIEQDKPAVVPGAVAACIGGVQRESPDEAIILTSDRQSCLPTALMLRQAGVPRLTGLSRDSAGSLLDVRIAGDLDVHEVERSLLLARAAGHVLPAADDGRLRLLAAPHGGPPLPESYVVVHPGSTAPARTLTVRQWQRVIAGLLENGYDVVVTGSDADRHARSALPQGCVDLTGRTSLAGLVDVLGRADVVVTGNTSALHIAAAAGTPVCAAFPPTVPVHRWRPYGVEHRVLGRVDVPCGGCHLRECDVGHVCVAHLGAGDVLDAVQSLTRAPGLVSAAAGGSGPP
jgi:ADP-heptose:LPS heptosyltransferase